MKNLLCSMFNCHSGSGWRECPRCQLKRVKLMRQLRRRKRAVMLGLLAQAPPCSAVGDQRMPLAPQGAPGIPPRGSFLRASRNTK